MRRYHDIMKGYKRTKSHKNVTTEEVILISKYQQSFTSPVRKLFIPSCFCTYVH